jgi:antitoxin ParD1/3/4
MTITLHPDQEAWLQARVAEGEFASVEAAARQLLAERIAEISTEGEDPLDDLDWMKPYVDEGIAAIERGEIVTLEQHLAELDAKLAAMK